MKLTLPMPPPINHTYGISGSRMYKTAAARLWEYEAGLLILEQWPGKREMFTGDVEVGIDWHFKFQRDIDAGIKIVLDLLQAQAIVLNDRQIKRITHVDIYKDKLAPRVELEVNELKK